MKKLESIIFGLILFCCFACNKDKIPYKVNNEPLSAADNGLFQKLDKHLDKYAVKCQVITTTLGGTSIYDVKEIKIDSFFYDTIKVAISENREHDYFLDRKIKDETIFISTELLIHHFGSHFYTSFNEDKIHFASTQDAFVCKCTNFLYFDNDSIFYEYHNINPVSVICRGTTK